MDLRLGPKRKLKVGATERAKDYLPLQEVGAGRHGAAVGGQAALGRREKVIEVAAGVLQVARLRFRKGGHQCI